MKYASLRPQDPQKNDHSGFLGIRSILCASKPWITEATCHPCPMLFLDPSRKKGPNCFCKAWDFNQSGSGWTTDKSWEWRSGIGVGGTGAWTDSPTGSYPNNQSASLFSPVLDMTGIQFVRMVFADKHSFETDPEDGYNYDFGYVEVSTDGGQTWCPPLHGATALQSSFSDTSVLLFPVDEKSSVQFRFRVSSDTIGTEDGWYVDNVRLYGVPVEGINFDPILANPTRNPLQPMEGQTVTISIDASDADGIAQVQLHYAVNGGNQTTVPMTLGQGTTQNGTYQYAINGMNSGTTIQYYFPVRIPAQNPEQPFIPLEPRRIHLFRSSGSFTVTGPSGWKLFQIVLPVSTILPCRKNNLEFRADTGYRKRFSPGRISCVLSIDSEILSISMEKPPERNRISSD